MKKLFYSLAALLAAATAMTSCDDNLDHTKTDGWTPYDLPYTEYGLTAEGCSWQFVYDDQEIVIINSAEELSSYLLRESEDFAPSIDFERESLVLAHGYAPNGIEVLNIMDFIQTESAEVTMVVGLVLNATDEAPMWTAALTTGKLPANTTAKVMVDVLTPEY